MDLRLCASQEVLSKTQLVSFRSYYTPIKNSSPVLIVKALLGGLTYHYRATKFGDCRQTAAFEDYNRIRSCLEFESSVGLEVS